MRPDIPFAGLFTQIGTSTLSTTCGEGYLDLCGDCSFYTIIVTLHRVYSDLADRKQCRESTWNEAEWNNVVANTVPLIRTMSTRILEPLPFSPTQ